MTLYTKRNDDVALPDKDETIHHLGLNKIAGGVLIVTWVVIWIIVAVFANTTEAGYRERGKGEGGRKGVGSSVAFSFFQRFRAVTCFCGEVA